MCVFIGYSCTFIQVDSYERNNCLLFNIIKSENLSWLGFTQGILLIKYQDIFLTVGI